jgi:hypothetical protein
MAIVFEKQKKPVNWILILSIAFAVIFISGLAYYLFFAPTPQIDIVLPAPLSDAGIISSLEFTDPGVVLSSPEFKNLKLYVGTPSVGTLGRSNPFIPL